MEESMIKDAKDALEALAVMIERSEKAQARFMQGTSQHTLLTNRIRALRMASDWIRGQIGEPIPRSYAMAELEQAIAPLTSLIQKSEKAQKRLKPGTWQHAMLERNLKALNLALPILLRATTEVSR